MLEDVPTLVRGKHSCSSATEKMLTNGPDAWRCSCCQTCDVSAQVLPLQNGVDAFGKVRSIVTSWGKGRPLVGWCNIVAAIQETASSSIKLVTAMLSGAKEPGLIKHWAANPPCIYYGEFEALPQNLCSP